MQDENTGLITDERGEVAPVDVPPLAELRWEQIRHYGHWTAERNAE